MSEFPVSPTIEEQNQGAPPSAPRPRKGRLLAVAILAIIAAAAFGAWYLLHGRLHESTDDATIEGHVIPISPRVAGHVSRVLVTDNQEVKKGDLLAEIDPRDFQVQLAQKQAALESAIAKEKTAVFNVEVTTVTSHAAVTQASSGVDSARSTLAAAIAAVGAARAEATKSAADLKRAQNLFKTRVISQGELDAAVAVAQATADSLRAAESQAKAVRAQVAEAGGRLDAAEAAPQQVAASRTQAEGLKAEVDQARANMEQVALQLSYTKICAPSAGRVAVKSVEEGVFVQVGQALMAIVSAEVWVVANFKETQLTHLRPGQPATIRVDTYPGKVFKGHVDSIQAGTGSRFSLLPAENATGNFVKVVQRVPVKIAFDEQPDSRYVLAPGMSVVPEVRVK